MAKEKVLNEKMDINTPFKDFVRKFKKQKTAIAAMFFIIALAVLAVVSYQIAPYGINEYDYTAIMQGPSAAHWFGTDEFGRDLFSRIICGTRISLSVGLFSVSIAAVCGTILGLLGGYYGGLLDSIIMRICDTLFAFPGIRHHRYPGKRHDKRSHRGSSVQHSDLCKACAKHYLSY